jgi:hypothetical protein
MAMSRMTRVTVASEAPASLVPNVGSIVTSPRMVAERGPPGHRQSRARLIVGELVASADPAQYPAVRVVLEQARETGLRPPPRVPQLVGT